MTRISGLLIPVVALLILTGCAESPAAPPSSSPVSTPVAAPPATATPTPTPTAPAAVALVVHSQNIAFYDADATPLRVYDYAATKATDVVAGLTAVLGTPVTTAFEGRNDTPSGVRYEWPGLELRTRGYLADVSEAEMPTLLDRWWVHVTSATSGSIRFQTVDGLTIGSAIGAAVESYPDADVSHWPTAADDGHTSTTIYLDSTPAPGAEADEPDRFARLWRVGLDDADGSGTVDDIRAPSANFGA